MPKTDYSATFKLIVLAKAREWDNIQKAAEHYGVSRRVVYNWMEQESELQKKAGEENEESLELTRRRVDILNRIEEALPASIDNADRYLEMLRQHGTLSERKKLLNAVVEGTLWNVVEELEAADFSGVHPKDLAKIMKDLENTREKLAGEPTVIIEERNRIKEFVFIAAKELFGAEKAKRLAQKIEAMAEAEYEEVG